MTINPEGLALRPETAHDADFLAILFRSTRDDLLQLSLPEEMLDHLMAMQFNAQQNSYRQHFPGAKFSVIEKSGEPIGHLVVDDGDAVIRLVFIALLPQERKHGYGRRLLRALQASAASAQKSLTLSVSTLNLEAKRLYLSLDFQISHAAGANLEMIWIPAENCKLFQQEFFM